MASTRALLRRGILLEIITLVWNVLGVVVVLTAAAASHSVALAGFGLDSLVEIGASIVVIWQLRGTHAGREWRALRLISIAFFALALYILAQSTRAFLHRAQPGESPLGVLWLELTFAVMLLLAAGKRATGLALGNPVLQAEARVTLVDAYLAGAVLVGLVLQAFCGLWWADPLAGLVIVFYGIREGFHAWPAREKGTPVFS